MVNISFQVDIKQIFTDFYQLILLKTIQNDKKYIQMVLFIVSFIILYCVYCFKGHFSYCPYQALIWTFWLIIQNDTDHWSTSAGACFCLWLTKFKKHSNTVNVVPRVACLPTARCPPCCRASLRWPAWRSPWPLSDFVQSKSSEDTRSSNEQPETFTEQHEKSTSVLDSP